MGEISAIKGDGIMEMDQSVGEHPSHHRVSANLGALSHDSEKSHQDGGYFFSLGNFSFHYKAEPMWQQFDGLLMMQALSEHLLKQGYENLSNEHIQIILQCLELDISERGNIPSFDSAAWGEVFIKLKDYFIVGIWD